jgi:hypothetical protein
MAASTHNMTMTAEFSFQGLMDDAEASNDLFWGRMARQRGKPGDAARADQALSTRHRSPQFGGSHQSSDWRSSNSPCRLRPDRVDS